MLQVYIYIYLSLSLSYYISIYLAAPGSTALGSAAGTGSPYPGRGPPGPELAVFLPYGSSLLSVGERCMHPLPP